MSGRLNGPTRARQSSEVAFNPTEEWRARFEAEATKPVLERLNRIARARLGIYSGGKHRLHDDAVDEIVIGALGDTWNGTLTWDPERRSLFLHVRDAIKYRVRDQARLTRHRKRDDIDEDESAVSLADRAAAGSIVPTVADDDAKFEAISGFVDATLDALRPLASSDQEVTSLLEALAKRVVDRHDLLEETGMTIVE